MFFFACDDSGRFTWENTPTPGFLCWTRMNVAIGLDAKMFASVNDNPDCYVANVNVTLCETSDLFFSVECNVLSVRLHSLKISDWTWRQP